MSNQSKPAPSASAKRKPKKAFKRQKIMERVLIALIPAFLGAIYFFGWRVLAMLVFVSIIGCAVEFYMARHRGDPLTGSCLVTCALFALSLPPQLPFWMAAVGIAVALFFGKEVFGGFGRNVFNPAIVGRAFVYVCFPQEMTSEFTPVWKGFPGGFAHWGPATSLKTAAGETMEAVTAATPMWFRRDYGFGTDYGPITQLKQLFTGSIGGVIETAEGTQRVLSAGSVGEVSALLLIVGGIYLLWTKTANWRLVLSSFVGAILASVLFRYVFGFDAVPNPLFTLFSGAMMYACFFMVTDPVSAPNDRTAQYVYGVFIGIMIVFFRWKAVFAGGVAFAILLGNLIAPTLEFGLKAYRKHKKEKQQAASEAGS
jgi:Na+-transporting NADH:ubiquinone oxidoreductase subunit B